MPKKTTTEKKRRGSAPGVQPKRRDGKPAVQGSLPGVSDGRIAKLEELDAERTEAKRGARACNDNAKAVEKRMIEVLKKSGRESYRTNSDFVLRVELVEKVTRRPVPKAKKRKGAAVPQGVA
jgi:hypothetical protein